MSFRYRISSLLFVLFADVLSCLNFFFFFDSQTYTSLAIEAKVMKRWEFDSIAQAANCISSWFSGKPSEQLLLKEHLNSAAGTNKDSNITLL